jgi:hypothetical protein
MRMVSLLVVILVVNEDHILALEFEGQAPIAVHLDGPVLFQIAAQKMQSPSGGVHVLCGLCSIQLKQLDRQLGGMGGLDSSFASSGKESFNAAMAEALDHAYSVALHVSLVKQSGSSLNEPAPQLISGP